MLSTLWVGRRDNLGIQLPYLSTAVLFPLPTNRGSGVAASAGAKPWRLHAPQAVSHKPYGTSHRSLSGEMIEASSFSANCADLDNVTTIGTSQTWTPARLSRRLSSRFRPRPTSLMPEFSLRYDGLFRPNFGSMLTYFFLVETPGELLREVRPQAR